MPVQLPRALRPFRTAQYRILAAALVISLLGAGTWLVALVFEVQGLGGSPIDLSFVATCNAVGLIASVLIAGVVADRVPQKRILVAVEAVKVLCFATAAVLGLSGIVEVGHLAAISFVLGVADGFFYPAYSALLPSLLPAEDLLPANGIEGVLRPTLMQAAGPILAGAVIAAAAPTWAFLIVAVLQLGAVGGLLLLRATPVRRELGDEAGRHPLASLVGDIRDGVRYMVRTPWFLGTLLFALVWVLIVVGPIEVLLPYAVIRLPAAVTDPTGGPAGSYALVLAGYGLGGALASLAVASFRLPRRYLSVMNLVWGIGTLPLVVVGVTGELWVMIVALFLVGVSSGWGTVIWGTLLQRRVPPEMLGRVSSLDFFVSLALMPISMAVAGPIGVAVGLGWVFLVAGAVPILLAVTALLVFRMRADEIAHPLDRTPPLEAEAGDPVREA